MSAPIVIGYHKIRGLAGPLRMMCYYSNTSFVNEGIGDDMKSSWFGGKKIELAKSNPMINLPYIIDGDQVITQSVTCCLYLGNKMGLDQYENLVKIHLVLDQTMDLRNELMKIVYPFAGKVSKKEDFPDAAKKHLQTTAIDHCTKLEGLMTGKKYMCGDAPTSGDFFLWEMLDQHVSIATSVGNADFLDKFPQLKALHAAMRSEPTLEKYFQADMYAKWAQNNGLYTHFTGQGENFEYGGSVSETITLQQSKESCPVLLPAHGEPHRLSPMECPKVGYHKIRGLGAPLRMMCYFKGQKFRNVGYGADMKDAWFGSAKKELINKNSCINLPYIVDQSGDGETVVTQSNTCLYYLGQKLGIDKPEFFFKNHMVLDQTMDLRNDLMPIVYPFGKIKEKSQFPEGAKKHIESSATTNFGKLEAFCVGPYMCGAEPQSGDFHVFEMLDQHKSICASIGVADITESFPKLKSLHAAMKAHDSLSKYFESDCYAKWAQNNALFTFFTGQGDNFEYGESVDELVA